MNKLAKKFKIGIALVLMLCLSFCFIPALNGVYAEDETLKLSISDILEKEEYKDQEITNKLLFNTTFEGNAENANDRQNGWQTAGGLTTGNSAISTNMKSENEIADMDGLKYSDIGAAEGDYAMLLICKQGTDENKTAGVAGIETIEAITIPARSIYLLTFKVKVVDLKKNVGLYITLNEVNSEIKEDNLKEIKISAIKSTVEKDGDGKEQTVYVNYGFLIQGSELYDTSARLSISLGYRDEDAEKEEDKVKGEVGVAAIDDIKMFSLSAEQKTALKGASNLTNANFSAINSSIPLKVKNGTFNNAINQGYDLANVKLFTPANFTQSTSLNNPETTWGIVNTNSAYFNTHFPGMINPGLSTYQTGTIDKAYNNVLMLNNNSNTNQRVVTDKFTASKNQIYEFTFEFCTPATKANFAEETNSVSFYLKNGDEVIYKMEDVYSYAEADHAQNTAKWQRLSLVLETANEAKDLTFEIVFGTETEAKSGTVYLDNVKLEVRSEEEAFVNIYENTLEIKDAKPDATDEEKYLEKGKVTLEDVKNLKENNIVKTFAFEDTTDTGATDKPTDDKKDESETTTTGTDLTYLGYVIPSVLFAVCLMAGLVIFYVKKIKISPRKKKAKKQTYDRKSTLKVQVEKKEEKKAKQVKLAPKIEKSKTKQEQITDLEKAYKNKQISLNKYLKQREKLEAEIMQVEDLMNE